MPEKSDSTMTDSSRSTALHSQEKAFSVLYVEDNPSNLRLVSKIIKTRPDINLITAHTGRLGIDMAISHIPDLILLDINLPEIDGIEVLKLLKQNDITRNISVIAVTADAMPWQIEAGKDAGFDYYLTKPLDVAHFCTLLEKYLPSEQKTIT